MTMLIKKPIVTEKSTHLEKSGKYVFIVSREATKQEVKKAIKVIFNVAPRAVNIVSRPPWRKKIRGRTRREKGYKKAIVTLEKGAKIDFARYS